MGMRNRIVATSALWIVLGACGGASEPAAFEGSPAASGAASARASASAKAQGSASASPLIASASAEPAPPPKTPKEIVTGYVAANIAGFGAHDAKKIASLYVPRAVIASPGEHGMEQTGRAEMTRDLAAMFDAFPDAQLSSVRLLSKGHLAVWEWVVRGTNTGDFMGHHATNKRIGYHGVSVLSFGDDGLVRHETMYFDFATVKAQLGLGSNKAKSRAADIVPTAPEEIFVQGDGLPEAIPALEAFFGACDHHDDKALAAMLTDDMSMSAAPASADQNKREFLKGVRDAAKAFPDASTDTVACFRFGEIAACETVWSATLHGPTKPGQRPAVVHAIDIVRLKDDKIASVSAFSNSAELTGPSVTPEAPPKSGPEVVKIENKGSPPKKTPPKK